MVGEKFAQYVVYMVLTHNSSLQIQKKYLNDVKLYMQGRHYALLFDKICVAEGVPQRYGTQVNNERIGGKRVFYPIESAAKVNFVRMKVGLGPIEDYAKRLDVFIDVMEIR